MQTTRRPLPRIPPPHLTPVRSADIRSYRPLPTPPPRSTDSSCASSIGSAYIQTPPSPHVTRDSSSSLSSITSSSSELLSKPRPGLRISVAPPTLGERNSFDPLTVRTPALCDPCSRRFSRVSATSSDGSPLVFEFPAVVNGPDVFELEKDGMSALAHTFSAPPLTHLTRTCFSPPHPAAEERCLRPYCYSTTPPITTNHNAYESYRNRPPSYCSQGRD